MKMSKVLQGIATIVFYVYFFGCMISVPYFNWQYAKNNGFQKWIFLGEVVSTAKAMIWPYYVVTYYVVTPSDQNNREQVRLSLAYYRDALGLAYANANKPLNEIPPEDRKEILSYYKKALVEAKRVDVKELKESSAELAEHFVTEYMKGLELLTEGRDSSDNQKMLTGQLLLGMFRNWLAEQQDEPD